MNGVALSVFRSTCGTWWTNHTLFRTQPPTFPNFTNVYLPWGYSTGERWEHAWSQPMRHNPNKNTAEYLKENFPYVSPLDWSPLVPLLHQSLVDIFSWVFLLCGAGEDFAHSRFMQCLVFPALTPATLLRVAAYKTGWIYLYHGLWAWGRGPSPILLEGSSFDSSKVSGVSRYQDPVLETNFHVRLHSFFLNY